VLAECCSHRGAPLGEGGWGTGMIDVANAWRVQGLPSLAHILPCSWLPVLLSHVSLAATELQAVVRSAQATEGAHTEVEHALITLSRAFLRVGDVVDVLIDLDSVRQPPPKPLVSHPPLRMWVRHKQLPMQSICAA
jgi:hypothetical protein